MHQFNTHIIQSQSTEITFREARIGMGIQNTLADLIKDKLLPLFESVLDEYDLKDYLIQIDEIEIDLGEIPSRNWENELLERTVKKFKQELKEKLTTPITKEDIKSISSKDKESYKPEGIKILSQMEGFLENFIYFLKTGILYWSQKELSIQKLENSVKKYLLKESNTNFLKELKAILFSNKNALERFLLQFSEELTEVVLKSLGYKPNQIIKRIEQLVRKLSLSPKDKKVLISVVKLLQISPTSSHTISNKMEQNFNSYVGGDMIWKILDKLEDKQQLEEVTEAIISSINKEVKKETSDLIKNKITPPILPTYKRETNAKADQHSYYITNAGLVLLHPFLIPFLTQLGCIKDKKWISDEAHQRAVILTQYLIKGEEELPEFDLILNKILCNYPLEKSLENKLELFDYEKEEAQKMLTDIIHHWQALKSISIEALRSTFLMRNGKLTHNERGWLLQAESKTWDVLIDRLPWGIGMIKNESMKDWLYVEW